MAYDGYSDKEARKAYLREYQREYMRAYRKKLKAQGIKRSWNSADYLQRVRLQAMDKLGGPKCVMCGCDRLEILEINHIHGGGNADFARISNQRQFYRRIINDLNATELYDVRCKPCNIVHYVQEILGISGHSVIWNPI